MLIEISNFKGGIFHLLYDVKIRIGYKRKIEKESFDIWKHNNSVCNITLVMYS